MPTYLVTKPAFSQGRLIGPGTSVMTHTVDVPYTKKNKPSWCGSPVVEENDIESDKGLTVKELKAELTVKGIKFDGINKKSELQKLLEDDENQQLKNKIDAAVSFTEPPSMSGPVEVL